MNQLRKIELRSSRKIVLGVITFTMVLALGGIWALVALMLVWLFFAA